MTAVDTRLAKARSWGRLWGCRYMAGFPKGEPAFSVARRSRRSTLTPIVPNSRAFSRSIMRHSMLALLTVAGLVLASAPRPASGANRHPLQGIWAWDASYRAGGKNQTPRSSGFGLLLTVQPGGSYTLVERDSANAYLRAAGRLDARPSLASDPPAQTVAFEVRGWDPLRPPRAPTPCSSSRRARVRALPTRRSSVSSGPRVRRRRRRPGSDREASVRRASFRPVTAITTSRRPTRRIA